MVVHPFDIKEAIFARHAQHVVLIHFPIALFVTGVVFDWVGQLSGKAALASAAYYDFLVAAVSSPLAVATGIVAWQLKLDGQRLHGLLLLHLVLGTTSALLMWLVWWLHFRVTRTRVPLPSYRLLLELLSVLVVGITGHLGGFLSGVNLPG
jgi:uncharacterized membrane protein